MNFQTPLIIACDFANEKELQTFLAPFGQEKLFLKLGLELIYSAGFQIIKKLKKQGHQIFLDLKLHDIPNTVTQSLKSLAQYQPDLITIHSLGGPKMLEAAQKVSQEHNLTLAGVSLLTSLNANDCQKMGFNIDMQQNIIFLFKLIKAAKINYVICSVQEATLARQYNLKPITPGIYLTKPASDQKRIAHPKEAFTQGAELIVIGRALTQHDNPYQVYLQILKELNYD